MKLEEYRLPAPGFEKIFRAEVFLGETFSLGTTGKGYQEIVTVTGGRFEGSINGEIMPFGGDWGLLYDRKINELNTKYLLKTDDGAFISIECGGKLIMDYETMTSTTQQIWEQCYFRQTVNFTAGDYRYRSLNEIVAFAVSVITSDGNVCLDVYKLI